MKKIKNHIENETIAGDPAGSEITSNEFELLRDAIIKNANLRSAKEKQETRLAAIRYKMIDYLDTDDLNNNSMTTVGDFVREYLKATEIKQKTFAEFLGKNAGNVAKLLNGTRHINIEIATILGNTFNIDPALWLRIQDKAELSKLNTVKAKYFKKYSLDRLVKLERAHAA
jgi:plasmid maintenance system antidote protein VapI